MRLRTDRAVVSAPATAANLGPGMDSLALALGVRDRINLKATVGTTRIRVDGPGSPADPHDESHPLVVALRAGLEHAGAPQVGVDLHIMSQIPRHRGLGAKTANMLLGLYAAQVLLGRAEAINEAAIVNLAGELGGEPVRLAAAMRGGCSLQIAAGQSIVLRTPPLIRPVVFIPGFSVTNPPKWSGQSVSVAAAARNQARLALLTMLLAGTEVAGSTEEFFRMLMTATEDELHQQQRDSSPASLALIGWLRAKEVPAVLSGDGPTVVSLVTVSAEIQHAARQSGWEVMELGVSPTGVVVEGTGTPFGRTT